MTVPALRGLTFADATGWIREAGLQVAHADEVEDDELLLGQVVRSEPAAGTKVERGSGVGLIVSKGRPLPRPRANFAVDKRAGAAPLEVSFTDRSEGNPTTWRWEFGDGGSSSEQNPTHTYAAAGSYIVKLTASNAQGSDMATKDGYVVVNPPLPAPTPDFSADPRTGVAPLTVRFTDRSDGNPTSWRWDFGDGSSSSDRSPTHIYLKPGSYTVVLTVFNPQGSASKRETGLVTVAALPACVATTFVSDEGGGPRCSGKHCDRLSIWFYHSAYLSNSGSCIWTWAVSVEESGAVSCGDGWFVSGMQCTGASCDNVALYCCRAR